MQRKALDDDLVMSLVELALARPSGERESYLRDACSADSELLEQVKKYVEWDERMDGFLVDPLYSILAEHHFEPGDVLDDRFRIVREVAQGGMGIVYEAWDEKLDRRIAVKCAKAGFRKRLPPEVRHARDIAHPNVCRIFEIHTASTEQGEIDFLAMEFLDGETLAERLQQGPVPKEEAATIARQLCAGLAEAHRNGVVHGDLKSGNVILTKETGGGLRAVITDFGLARRPEAAQRTVQSGEGAGTPDYMAPELLHGEKASTASDVYALGVILHELVSGRRPNAADGKPAVYQKWDPILARCLDADPARRFRDGAEVAQAFAPPRSRRWLLGVAAAVLLAAVSGVVTHQRALAPRESVRLVALPFASQGVDQQLFGGISDQLARIKSSNHTKLTFVPVRKDVDTLEEARSELGATHVLHGKLTRTNERVTFLAYLTDVRNQANAKEWKFEYAPGEERYAPVALAGMVTGTLHLAPLVTRGAVNAAANPDYLQGLAYLQRYDGVDAALPVLQRAVAADPDSPLTHAALAEAEWLKFALTKDRTFLDRATDSVARAQSRNPDLAPVHDAAGLLHAHWGFYERAISEYRRAIELDPNDGDAHRRLGVTYQTNNQLDEALISLKKAVEVQPKYFKPFQSLGAFYNRTANYEEAAKSFQKMADLAPDLPEARSLLGIAYSRLGRFVEAERELRACIARKETAQAAHTLGIILMHQGREQEAISSYLRALSIGPETGRLWLDLGVSYSRTGKQFEALSAFKRGLAWAENEIVKDPRNGGARAEMAYSYARLGDPQRAKTEAAQALHFSPNDRHTRWVTVMTYEALGLRDKTLASLGSSPPGMIPTLLAELTRYPEMAGLSRDPRFLQLRSSYPVR